MRRARAPRGLNTIFFAAFIGACTGKDLDKREKPLNIGRFRLHTYPMGARVWIGGELKVEATPATLVLKEGKYRLKIQAPGAEAIEQVIEVEAAQAKELTINIPKPPEARIGVFSDVVGADVRINGYRRGSTPLPPAVTKPGPIDITVTTPGGRAKSVKTELAIGEQKRIDVNFDKIASMAEPSLVRESRPVPKGYLTLGLKPDGEVFTDEGQRLGETPIVRQPIDPGEHELLLRSLDGRYEKRVSIEVEADQPAVFRFQFRDEDQVPAWKPPHEVEDGSTRDSPRPRP